MWTCKNCENQNEENFKFCWSCGKPKTFEPETNEKLDTKISFSKHEAASEKEIPQVKSIEKSPPVREKENIPLIKPLEEFEEPEPERRKRKSVKVKSEIKLEAEKQISKEEEKPRVNVRQQELFSTFLPESERGKVFTDSETDWESILFTTAVRIVGLYFIFLVLISIPTLVSSVYLFISAPNAELASFTDIFANALFILIAKMLFYLILGVYLISSGRLILWFLPRK